MSIASFVGETIVFVTACPAFARSRPPDIALVVWGAGGGMAWGVDLGWLFAKKKITQLNEDPGVVLSSTMGFFNLGLFLIWEFTDDCPPLVFAGGLIGSLPGVAKLLRLTPIEAAMEGANRVLLAIADGLLCVPSGVLNFIASIDTLPDSAYTGELRTLDPWLLRPGRTGE